MQQNVMRMIEVGEGLGMSLLATWVRGSLINEVGK